MKTKRFTGKIMALVCCLALMLVMLPASTLAHTTTGPVFDGTTTGSLTINKTDGAGNAINDVTLQYSIFKIATVSQTNSGGVVSLTYTYDSGVVLAGGGAATGAVPSGVTAATYDVSAMAATDVKTNTGASGTLKFTGLQLGLYLVVETVTPAGVTQSNDFLVSIPMSTVVGGNQVWDYDPVATPKNTVIDGNVSKTITSGASVVGGFPKTWTASLGSTIAYEVTTKIPTTFTVTPFTTYAVKDIPSAGLMIDLDGGGTSGSFDGITVKVGATTLVKGTDYTITASGTGFIVELITEQPTDTTPGNQSALLTNGAVVTITYSATLSPSATATAFTNDVQVNSSYNTAGIPVTPPPITPPPADPPPTVLTYNYALQKVDGDNANAPLAGATFAIQNASGNYLAWTAADGWGVATDLTDSNLYTFTSDTATNAIVPFKGLAGGTYKIVEIDAPNGYSKLSAPITVTLDAASTTAAAGTGYSIQVVNTIANIWILPSTGGMGIYIYAIGGVLLIAAAVILFTRNRKKNETE